MQTLLVCFMYTTITTIILIISVGTWREISLSRRSNTQRDGRSLAASSAASWTVLSFSPQNCNSAAWVLSLPNIWLAMNYWTKQVAQHKHHHSYSSTNFTSWRTRDLNDIWYFNLQARYSLNVCELWHSGFWPSKITHFIQVFCHYMTGPQLQVSSTILIIAQITPRSVSLTCIMWQQLCMSKLLMECNSPSIT